MLLDSSCCAWAVVRLPRATVSAAPLRNERLLGVFIALPFLWNSRKVIQNFCNEFETGPWNSPGCMEYEAELQVDFLEADFSAFLQGVFGKSVFFCVVFAGEVVVN